MTEPLAQALTDAAKTCAARASNLAVELALDWDACRMGEALTPDGMAALGRQAANAAWPVLGAVTRMCGRCTTALETATDRVTGFCGLCRADRDACRQRIAAAAAGGRS